MKKELKVYYLSVLTAIVIGVLIILEINSVFDLFKIYDSQILVYIVYYSAALLIPLVLLSSILVFRFSKTNEGKKGIRLLTNMGITYAVIKVFLVIFASFDLFKSGVL